MIINQNVINRLCSETDRLQVLCDNVRSKMSHDGCMHDSLDIISYTTTFNEKISEVVHFGDIPPRYKLEIVVECADCGTRYTEIITDVYEINLLTRSLDALCKLNNLY